MSPHADVVEAADFVAIKRVKNLLYVLKVSIGQVDKRVVRINSCVSLSSICEICVVD